jgi:hypothetical protein
MTPFEKPSVIYILSGLTFVIGIDVIHFCISTIIWPQHPGIEFAQSVDALMTIN